MSTQSPQPDPSVLLTPGSLRSRIQKTSLRALASGALLPLPTARRILHRDGVGYQLRVLERLVQKEQARESRAAAPEKIVNPFLPYEEGLFVCDLTDSHVGLLNKFNVLEDHLLMVTRRYEDQEELLTPADFEVMAICLREIDGLAFYNGGEEAGASEPHKHLQIVPLPLAPGTTGAPLEPLLLEALARGVDSVPSLPYRNSLAPMDRAWVQDPAAGAESLRELYLSLLTMVSLTTSEAGPAARQPAPYNLLATRRWMMAIPRSRERWEGVSVNGLGFAGSFFLRREEQAKRVEKAGPLKVLSAVGVPR